MKRGRTALDGRPMAAVPTRFYFDGGTALVGAVYPEMVSREEGKEPMPRVGLCASCRFVRRIESDRASVFYMCQRSATDPGFPKYPPLPVLQCAGYEPTGSGNPSK